MRLRSIRGRQILLFCLIFALLYGIVSPLALSSTASAVAADNSSTNPDDWLPSTRAKRWAYLTALYACMDGENWNDDVDGILGTSREIKESDVKNGTWFETGKLGNNDYKAASYVNLSPTRDDGRTDCNKIVKATAQVYGVSNIALFCGVSENKKRDDGGDCLGQSGQAFAQPDKGSRWNLKSIWGTPNLPGSPGPAGFFEIYKAALFNKTTGCNLGSPKGSTGDYLYTIPWNNGDDSITSTKYGGKAKTDTKFYVYTDTSLKEHEMTCGQIESAINNKTYSGAYAQWAADHQESVEENRDGGDPGAGSATSSCGVNGIGWIICPVMVFLADLNDAAFAFLVGYLQIPTIDPDGGSNWFDGTKLAWDTFRNFANIAFVIAFMVIIYSQITGAGLNNYGIKKLLPKLVVAAILVNVSFYLCVAAVEVSNVVGTSTVDIFNGLSGQLVDANANVNVLEAEPSGWDKAVSALLTVGTGLALVLIIFLAPSVLLVFGVIIFILMARQAAIILLVAISPLAFVAYLLPNTEQWFQKWWKLFSSLLMVFPIIALVFGASTLASVIVGNVAADDGQMLALIALGIQAIPLFAVPVLLKGAMSAAGNIGQKLSGFADKAQGRGVKGIKQGRIGEAAGAFKRRSEDRKVNRRLGQGMLAKYGQDPRRSGTLRGKTAARLGTLQSSFDQSTPGKYLGGDRGAAAAVGAVARRNKEEEEIERAPIEAAKAGMAGHDWGKLESIATSPAASGAERKAAIEKLAEQGAVSELRNTQTAAITAGTGGEFNDAVRRYSGSLAAKAPDLITDATPDQVFDGVSTETVAGWHASTLDRAFKGTTPAVRAKTLATFEAAVNNPQLVGKLTDKHYKAYKDAGGNPTAVAAGIDPVKWASL